MFLKFFTNILKTWDVFRKTKREEEKGEKISNTKTNLKIFFPTASIYFLPYQQYLRTMESPYNKITFYRVEVRGKSKNLEDLA